MALRTKSDLLSFVAGKVYQNTSNAITGQMCQDAINELVDNLYGPDLASTSEVLTNEV